MDIKTMYYTDNYLSVSGICVGKKMYRVLKKYIMGTGLGWAGGQSPQPHPGPTRRRPW